MDAGGRDLLRLGASINAAMTEATFVGLLRRLDRGGSLSPADVASAIESIRSDGDFIAAVTQATADEENVRRRLETTTRALGAI